jgi:D-amino-acid dehydrogenase
VEAAAYYPTLIARLQTDQGGDTGYAVCGKLTVAVSPDEIEDFTLARQCILARQEQRGQPSREDLYDISSREAQSLLPALAPVHGALYSRHAARVDGRLLTQALRNAAESRGLRITQANVERLVMHDQAVTGVVVDGATLKAPKTAIAGGAWSPTFAAQLNVPLPVYPQRGQIIHLRLPGTDTSAWPIVSAFHHHYIVAWPDSRVVVGATRETGSGFQPVTTAAGIHEVLGEALRVAPGLASANIHEIRVGLRPYTTPDTLPVLGPVPQVRQVFLATGHGPTGLTLGPYSGKLIAEMMLDQAGTTDLSAFSVTRFL